MLPSACLARLILTCSGLKLQAILNAQIDKSNCLEWGNKISKAEYFEKVESIFPIHGRLIEEPDFMVSYLLYNSIKSLVINFTSALEFYLKDSMRLNMMRNYSLLKKALAESKQEIAPNDIVDINDIEQLRSKYIYIISDKICSGELWKNKFKKYIKLLSLPNDLGTEEINNKIDSIWRMRNDIAHANSHRLSLNYSQTTYTYNSSVSTEDYTQFALLFIGLVDEVIAFLSKTDALSLQKWEATDATLLHS